jgi:hypothetical protein
MFGPGINTLRDWEKLEAETGSLKDKPPIRGAYKSTVRSCLPIIVNIHLAQTRKLQLYLIAAFPGFAARKGLWELREKKHNSIC